MADPLSIASGVLTLAGAAYTASKGVYQTIESYRGHDQTMKELKTELETLQMVLGKLQKACMGHETEYQELCSPLAQCATVCEGFDTVLKQATKHSQTSHNSVRDWLKAQYKGENISSFKNQMASYKATISIAISYVVLTKASVTLQFIETLQQETRDSQYNLQGRLETIDAHLDDLALDVVERQQWQEERQSILQSVDICRQTLEAAGNKQPSVYTDVRAASDSIMLLQYENGPIHAERVTAEKNARMLITDVAMSSEVLMRLSNDQREIALKRLSSAQDIAEATERQVAGGIPRPFYEETSAVDHDDVALSTRLGNLRN